MVRVFTFAGLLAGTYLGVKALDNLVIWMAERREANMENFKLDREAAHMKQELLKSLQEKQAIPNYKAPKPQGHPQDHHQDGHQECDGDIVAECLKCGELFEIPDGVPHTAKEKSRY